MTTRAGKGAPLSAAEYDAGLGFSTVAALLADTLTTHSTGEILRAENYRYRVVSTGQHLTTAGGVKLTVLPDTDGLYPFGAWGALTTDSNISVKLSAAMNAVSGLRMPPGTYNVNSAIFRPADGEFIWVGEDTTLILNNNINFRSADVENTFTLTSNIARGAVSFTVSNGAAAVVGKSLHFAANVIVETGWNTTKREMRMITAVSGNTITVDAPFDFPWNTTDTSLVVTQRGMMKLHMRGININVITGGEVGLSPEFYVGDWKLYATHLQDSVIEHCTFTGPAYQWLSHTFSDLLKVAFSNRVVIRDCQFTNARYAPCILEASRFVTIRNCVVSGLRHIDCNTFCQDTTVEDCVGINTQCVIQTHPSIRSTFRRIKDLVADSTDTLRGFCPRSLGVLVEDCEALNTRGAIVGVGVDTQYLLMASGWESFPLNFDKTFIRVKTDYAVLAAVQANRVQIFDCDVPGISASDSSHTAVGSVYISPDTRVRVAGATAINWMETENRGPVNVTPVNQGSYKEIRYATNPFVGGIPKTHFIASIYTEAAPSATTFALPVRIYSMLGSAGSGGQRQCEVIVRAVTATGFAETHYRQFYYSGSGTGVSTPVLLANLNYNYGSVTAAISTPVQDVVNATKLSRYWGFTIDVTVPASTALYNVELEVIERRAGGYA